MLDQWKYLYERCGKMKILINFHSFCTNGQVLFRPLPMYRLYACLSDKCFLVRSRCTGSGSCPDKTGIFDRNPYCRFANMFTSSWMKRRECDRVNCWECCLCTSNPTIPPPPPTPHTPPPEGVLVWLCSYHDELGRRCDCFPIIEWSGQVQWSLQGQRMHTWSTISYVLLCRLDIAFSFQHSE